MSRHADDPAGGGSPAREKVNYTIHYEIDDEEVGRYCAPASTVVMRTMAWVLLAPLPADGEPVPSISNGRLVTVD